MGLRHRTGLLGAAFVSRGGWPDLAGDAPPLLKTPTLLIVGGNDVPVTGMNEEAMERLRVEKELGMVPGARHLFEEPGALEEVARLPPTGSGVTWIRTPRCRGGDPERRGRCQEPGVVDPRFVPLGGG